MGKKKPKVPKTKFDKDPAFIPFGKIHRNYIREVFIRTNQEFNAAVEAVYEEMGIQGRVSKNPDRYKIRPDFSGVDILPPPPKKKPPKRNKEELEQEKENKAGKESTH